MKTDGVTQRGEIITFAECDVFENDDLERGGERTYSRENDGGAVSKATCVASSCEDTDEGINTKEKTQATSEHSRKILESETTNGRETTEVEEELYVDCGTPTPMDTKVEQAAHYAEILTTKPCASTISMRRTRESSNPILCLRYGERNPSEGGDHTSMKQSANTQYRLPRKTHHSFSNSEIFYVNTTDGLTARQPEDEHVYANFENEKRGETDGQTSASNEISDTESLYEDINDIYEAMSPRCTSKPIGIVYASMDFSRNTNCTTSPSSVGSCSLSSSIGSLERPDRCATYSSESLPRSSSKPPELPQRTTGSLSRSRPCSVHLGNRHDIAEFGMYTGTLVGKCTVAKSSPKSIQHVVGDFLAREKKERSKPVSLEVTSEFLRLSLNCAPWSLLAQNTLDDVGCVTTVSANNKTALGYTVSKPGEDAYCYVLHCSDADAIKNSILSSFKRPDTSISKWSSMCSLGKSMSLPSNTRLRGMSRHNNELAIFDDLVYLGSYKAKKSYIIVNDNIAEVLDHTASKQYTYAKVELYKDAIHLKNSKTDCILDIHQLQWIIAIGLFDEDRRYFGYISSKAIKGSKTRNSCHVFRCNRVERASEILETIRRSCQTTFLATTPENHSPDQRARVNSTTSSSSEESMSSTSETTSMGSASSSPAEIDGKSDLHLPVKHRLRRFGEKARSRMSTIMSFAEDETTNDIVEEKDEPQVVAAATKVIESRLYNVSYLCSTIVSPPLKPQHVKQCLKQHQKAMDKQIKKSKNARPNMKVQLLVNQDGIMIVDDPSKPPQVLCKRAALYSVQGHPEGKCAFAFSEIVSGNTKHKCHLFLQDKEPMEEIIKDIQSQIQQK